MADADLPIDAPTTSEQLRVEIISAQSARTDLLKYKLVVCAILGAVALGTGPAAAGGQLPQVAGIIPAVCLYIDALCNHNDIRILVIGQFLASEGEKYDTMAGHYESFASSLREVFKLERLALNVSTMMVSIAVAGAGVIHLSTGRSGKGPLIAIELIAGAFGVVGSLVLTRRTDRLIAMIHPPGPA